MNNEDKKLEEMSKIDKNVFWHGVLPLMCLVGAFIYVIGKIYK
jgi:hypothetical protein